MLKVILIKFVEGDADKIVEELPQMQGFSFSLLPGPHQVINIC